MDHDDILDTSKLCFDGSFDDQVQGILHRVRWSRLEVQALRPLLKDVEEALQQLVAGCRITPFGSLVTGLGIKTSDVDCHVGLPGGMLPSKQCVIRARNILRQNHRLFTNLFAITAAKVPIVKFTHVPTGCECDVSFAGPSAIRNSELLGFLLEMDKRALDLCILIKYWSKVYVFTGTNYMPNYALTLLVIFYLQTRKILPPVKNLQCDIEPWLVDNWNTAFNDKLLFSTDNSESVYDLMGGFFKYYANFNYDLNVISPYLGHIVTKKNLTDVPKDFDLYMQNLTNKVCKQLRMDKLMCVQDPFDHSRNCTIAMYPRLMEKIMSHFRHAASAFDQVDAKTYLTVVFTQDPTPKLEGSATPKRPQPFFHNKIRPLIPDWGIKKRPRQRAHNPYHGMHGHQKKYIQNMYQQANNRRHR